MQVDGQERLKAPRDDVWKALMDPEVLARCIPGCKSLERKGENSFSLEVQLGIAAVKGTYLGEVEIRSPKAPESFTLSISAQGPTGVLNAALPIHLAPEGEGTLLTYGGEAEVGGVIAGVGQRVMGGVAKMVVKQFFDALAKTVARA